MTENKNHNRLERLIKSLTITDNQKDFLQEKADTFFNMLKSISQDLTPYWSSLYLSKSTYKYTLKRFWFRGSFERGLFIKNRFDVEIYFIYSKNNTSPNEKSNLIGKQLFELLYSNLKVYEFNYRENMKLLKLPPYGHNIPIRLDYHSISILFDCVPSIELSNGDLIIPNGMGGIKKISPTLEEKALSKLNKKQNGKITKLIVLMKYWNFNWGKSIEGYLVERLVESIFDKIAIQSWDQTVKTFFNQAISILDKQKFLPDRVFDKYSLLDEYSSDDLNKFIKVIKEAKNCGQKGEWKNIFSVP